MNRMIESVDGIITGCARGQANLRNIQLVRAAIRILPPLTRLDIPQVTERSYDATTPINVVMIGRQGRGKGTELLLEIWHTLRAGPALLHIYGDCADAALRSHAQDTAARDPTIHLHGAYTHAQLPNILEGADIGLVLSAQEGYGLTACEYMAAGVPFVTTDVGAAPEFTRRNPDATIVPVEATAIREGIGEFAHRVRRGETSRKRLARHYQAAFSFDYSASQHLRSFTEPTSFWASAQ
jgi:glycosyltransferase involved in cell wall biosynthesis